MAFRGKQLSFLITPFNWHLFTASRDTVFDWLTDSVTSLDLVRGPWHFLRNRFVDEHPHLTVSSSFLFYVYLFILDC